MNAREALVVPVAVVGNHYPRGAWELHSSFSYTLKPYPYPHPRTLTMLVLELHVFSHATFHVYVMP